MEDSHGRRCPMGCIDNVSVKAGSVLQFSANCLADIAQYDMTNELIVILRSSTSETSFAINNDRLYHCAVVSRTLSACEPFADILQITRSPSAELGPAHSIHLALQANIPSLHSLGKLDLYVFDRCPSNWSPHYIPMIWSLVQYLQPTNIKRIPARCLHKLPGNMKLEMDPISIETILHGVEWLAGALANIKEKPTLPDGMQCQRRQENVLVLSLLRSVDRFIPEDMQHPGRRERGRAQSIWAQGVVPRNGGH